MRVLHGYDYEKGKIEKYIYFTLKDLDKVIHALKEKYYLYYVFSFKAATKREAGFYKIRQYDDLEAAKHRYNARKEDERKQENRRLKKLKKDGSKRAKSRSPKAKQ